MKFSLALPTRRTVPPPRKAAGVGPLDGPSNSVAPPGGGDSALAPPAREAAEAPSAGDAIHTATYENGAFPSAETPGVPAEPVAAPPDVVPPEAAPSSTLASAGNGVDPPDLSSAPATTPPAMDAARTPTPAMDQATTPPATYENTAFQPVQPSPSPFPSPGDALTPFQPSTDQAIAVDQADAPANPFPPADAPTTPTEPPVTASPQADGPPSTPSAPETTGELATELLPEEANGLPRGLTAPTRPGRSERLIGEVIVDLGFARREAVEKAVVQARERGRTTGQTLIENGIIRHDQLARALAERFGVDYVDLSLFDVDMGAAALVPAEVAKRYQALPIAFLAEGTLLVAMSDPSNVLTRDEISMITDMRIRPAAAADEDLAALIARLNRLDEAVAEFEEPVEPEREISLEDGPPGDAPIVKLVQSIIAQAVEQGASDIHCNPELGDMQVLFRIDGVLTPAATVTRSMAGGVVSRIKIMANMDIAERRVPQDGRMAVTIDGHRVDVRVVTLPLVRGESVVMRILDTAAVVRDLQSLGMQGTELEHFVSAIRRPYGAVLVTGPTGSGKSTTLYGALGVINDGQRGILTIEDPVESQIAGIKQMPVSPKAGVTFATGLRSMLRADPDVIMVGEIRDRETAEISVQAALTGHLVLTTLHTRDAVSAVTRLIDMGIEPFMAAAAIDCVVAQRLARTLCVHCKRSAVLPDSLRAEYGFGDAEIFEAVGCVRCASSGYRGRTGLYEVMSITEEMRNMVLARRGVDEIAAAAVHAGMRSMRTDGMEKVKQGVTSLVEVGRVTSSL